ncbi:MAG: (Fe-S)-binding protein [Planctomycetes bacterium]|nr:(Fe-S)-binding protein [Planctomycetota bacterium]
MKVALFVTCLTDTYYPRVGEAVVRVLRHFGCDVEFPAEQTCCGQPAFNSGFHDEAAAVARRMLRVFEPYETVVTPSASCASMVRHHFPELLADDATERAAAERLAARTHEFSTFLANELSINISKHLEFDEPITFHYPCHARGVYALDELTGWLAGAAVDLRRPGHADLCCGFGGVFSVEFPEISGAILKDKLEELSATGARLVVCNEGGCALNMSGGAHRRGIPLRFKHLAECLAESLGLMESDA